MVSCCSKNSPLLNWSIPWMSSPGAGSSQRARSVSCGAPGGGRFGGRAAFRARLLASGARSGRVSRRPRDLAEEQLVFEELGHGLVFEIVGRLFWVPCGE